MAKRLREADANLESRRRMRLRFKRLARLVLVNMNWLDETEEQGIVMNAKRNVAFLVRQKRKTGVLTVAEKALLRTSQADRTIEERKRLCMIISNLPCFVNIPPKLRARLVPVLKFNAISEDRVLIKYGDQPIIVYFIVSGEIEMKKPVFDKITKKISMVSEALMGSGDWIGEVEMLEDCIRLNNYVAITACEVLSITVDEFQRILGPYMRKQWLEKRAALRSLNYFDFLTNDQIVRACNYCQLIQYDPLQSIYSEDRGAVSWVYFILSGECVILQCLKMSVKKDDGKKTFELISAQVTDNSMFQQASKNLGSVINSEQFKDKMLTESFNLVDLLASSSDIENEENLKQKKARRKMGLRDIEIACGLLNKERTNAKRGKSRTMIKRKTTVLTKIQLPIPVSYDSHLTDENTELDYMPGRDDYFIEEFEMETDYIDIDDDDNDDDDYNFDNDDDNNQRQSQGLPMRESDRRSSTKSAGHSSKQGSRNAGNEDSPTTSSYGSDFSSSASTIKASNLSMPLPTETHFIDVGSLTFGAIFGLGEKMAHRVIMARTVVQCLLLPRYWLMQEEQNPGHIWKRLRFALENSIPSREELFDNFLKTRRWEKFKDDYVQSTLNPNISLGTQPEDIPIICRIVETRDDI